MLTLTSSEADAAGSAATLAAFPSPPASGIELGPLTLHFYALCILLGVILAVVWSESRWKALGGQPGTITDLAIWAVPAGLIGGRLYHVISDYQLYFGPESRPAIEALYIWQGGLGIWGAVPLGALAVWLVARSRGLSMSKLSFAIVPSLALAQGIGRWGNWFNQELFGAPTDLPWGLSVDPVYRPEGYGQFETFHPTFLYESLWCIALAIALAWAGNRFYGQTQGGRLFALYVMGYTLGRFWIEYLRIDEANMILGFRLNNWTALVVFLAALAYFVWAGRNMDRFSDRVTPPGRETPAASSAAGGDPAAEPEDAESADEPLRPEEPTADQRPDSSPGGATP